MVDQTSILKVLQPRAQATIDQIVDALERRSGTPASRKQVLQSLGKLMQKKLASRAQLFGEPKAIVYAITQKGRELLQAGKRVTSGPNGNLTAARQNGLLTFRQRLWNVLRMAKKASVAELIELARLPKDGEGIARNAQAYLQALARAGVIAELRKRDAGAAPTSPGFKRYVLMKDLGTRAPSVRRAYLHDFNRGQPIPYTDKEAA